jgi:hypothetical protein
VGPGAVQDAAVNRKIPSPRRESNPRTPIIQPVATPTEQPRLQFLTTVSYLTCRDGEDWLWMEAGSQRHVQYSTTYILQDKMYKVHN